MYISIAIRSCNVSTLFLALQISFSPIICRLNIHHKIQDMNEPLESKCNQTTKD